MPQLNPTLLLVLLCALVFAAVVMAVFALNRYWEQRQQQSRFKDLVGVVHTPTALPTAAAPKASRWMDSLYKLSLPAEGWGESQIRLKFLRAGFRQSDAPRIYYVIKSLLVLVVPVLVWLGLWLFKPAWPSSQMALVTLLTAAAGYYGPDVFLQWRTQTRRDTLQRGLPDLVDLLVVALESGMGLDAAITRVSKELARSHALLAEEFYLAGLEVRAGAGRMTALKNLALRMNLDDLNGLVTMLNQSERFGTSLGEALRVQSEVMRLKRGQRAEEIAAKIPVKMLFPLIFFIFPSIMVVLIGPGWMQISAAFGFK
ncbi:type II secretion system F family protein [Limnohabitans sp. 2KL-3]|uniref:type II secretion system F family protein n=1 Tax=Limnohabitans sp. 2KL-3 TaxID=1100700 RepID=UPI000B3258B1|nr:type II secretion system F family protein [Limnohabitans sp. 2KL-3]